MSSRVTGLPARDQRLDRAQRDRPASEHHVERGHEDVQVLGVQHEDQERQHHADVEDQADADQRGAVGQHLAEQVGDERGLAVAVVAVARAAMSRASTAPRKRNSVQTTLKIMNRVKYAGTEVGAEEPGPAAQLLGAGCGAGSPRRRAMPTRAITAMKSCTKPSTDQLPKTNQLHSGLRVEQDRRRPRGRPCRGSRTPRTRRSARRPGTDHFSSFFWPKTSTTWRLSAAPSRPVTPLMRSGAGWPLVITR